MIFKLSLYLTLYHIIVNTLTALRLNFTNPLALMLTGLRSCDSNFNTHSINPLSYILQWPPVTHQFPTNYHNSIHHN